MIIVHDLSRSPVWRSFHSSQSPAAVSSEKPDKRTAQKDGPEGSEAVRVRAVQGIGVNDGSPVLHAGSTHQRAAGFLTNRVG